MWVSMRRTQVLHTTLQHQTNSQSHFPRTTSFCVECPRSQHKRPHPSAPVDVALHARPDVPSVPIRRLAYPIHSRLQPLYRLTMCISLILPRWSSRWFDSGLIVVC